MKSRSKYPWPASRLSDEAIMHDLFTVSRARKQPMTRLIEEAVRAHVARIRDEMDALQPRK